MIITRACVNGCACCVWTVSRQRKTQTQTRVRLAALPAASCLWVTRIHRLQTGDAATAAFLYSRHAETGGRDRETHWQSTFLQIPNTVSVQFQTLILTAKTLSHSNGCFVINKRSQPLPCMVRIFDLKHQIRRVASFSVFLTATHRDPDPLSHALQKTNAIKKCFTAQKAFLS